MSRSVPVSGSITLGVTFWLMAALTVRFVGPMIFKPDSLALLGAYVAAIPITYGFVFIALRVLRVAMADILLPAVIMTATATLLDGLALAWFSRLYADTSTTAHAGAAWILWGAGIGLVVALVHGRVESSHGS
jgi:Family of unknown function (DUF5367)